MACFCSARYIRLWSASAPVSCNTEPAHRPSRSEQQTVRRERQALPSGLLLSDKGECTGRLRPSSNQNPGSRSYLLTLSRECFLIPETFSAIEKGAYSGSPDIYDITIYKKVYRRAAMTATVPGHIYARDGRMLQQHIDLEIFTIAFLIAVLSFLVRTFIGTSYSHIPSLSIGLRLFSFFNKSRNNLLFSVFGGPTFCSDSSFRFSLPTSVLIFLLQCSVFSFSPQFLS